MMMNKELCKTLSSQDFDKLVNVNDIDEWEWCSFENIVMVIF